MAPPRSLRPADPPRKSRTRRLLRWALWVALPVLAVGIGTFVGIMYAFTKVPLPAETPRPEATLVYDSTGRGLIGTLVTHENRREVAFKDIPLGMRRAVLAAEDRQFYEHGALSYRGLLRALWANLTRRQVAQGGSTITQQYVKNAFPDYVGSDRTLFRKFKEAIVAIKLEQKYTKDEILGFYLNTIYFGRGAYGVEAAARTYYGDPPAGKDEVLRVRQLNPAQMAFLAGAIRSPEFYSKKEHAASAVARRNLVLKAMAEEGWLSRDQLARASALKLGVAYGKVGKTQGATSRTEAYFLEKVRQHLIDRYGEDRFALGGFVVQTTLDRTLQREAERAVNDFLAAGGRDPLVALVALDPRTGAVRAMYGGSNFYRHQFNLATDSRREAGSTMKPFVLERFLDRGMSLRSRFKGPSPYKLADGTPVDNFGDVDYGYIDLLEATRKSVNTVYMQLIEQVGPQAVKLKAEESGMDDRLSSKEPEPGLQAVPALALGGSGVTTLQLASAFGTWANKGAHVEPYIVESIKHNKTNRRERHRPEPKPVVKPEVAALVNHALQGVIEGGSGWRARLPYPAAGKTGTTNEATDARFVGYTPGLVTSVWMGFEDPKDKLVRIHGQAEVTGGSFPAMIWKDFMRAAIDRGKLERLDFDDPDLDGGIVVNPPTTLPPTTLPPSTAPPTTVPPPTTPQTTTVPSLTVPQSSSPLPGTTQPDGQDALALPPPTSTLRRPGAG